MWDDQGVVVKYEGIYCRPAVDANADYSPLKDRLALVDILLTKGEAVDGEAFEKL